MALTATVFHVDLTRGSIEIEDRPRGRLPEVSRRQRARRVPPAAVHARRRRSAGPGQRAGDGGEPAHRARHLRPEPHDGVRPLAAHRGHRRQPVRRLLPRRDAVGRRRRHRLHRSVARARLSLAPRRPGRAPAREASVGQGHRRGRSAAQGGSRRRQGRGGADRAGRREPGALRRDHEHGQPGQRPHRARRGDGLEAPQGGGGARRDDAEAGAAGGVPRAREAAQGAPGGQPRHRVVRPVRHRRRPRHPGQDGRPAHAQLHRGHLRAVRRTSTARRSSRPS